MSWMYYASAVDFAAAVVNNAARTPATVQFNNATANAGPPMTWPAMPPLPPLPTGPPPAKRKPPPPAQPPAPGTAATSSATTPATVPSLATSFVPPAAAAPIPTIPLSADYGYGFNRATAFAEGTTDPSAYAYNTRYPTVLPSAAATGSNQASLGVPGAGRGRGGGGFDRGGVVRGRGGYRGGGRGGGPGASDPVVDQLKRMAGYSGSFVREGQAASAASAATGHTPNAAYSKPPQWPAGPSQWQNRGGWSNYGGQETSPPKAPQKPKDYAALYANIGRHVYPKSPTMVLADILGFKVDYRDCAVRDEDYDAFYNDKGKEPYNLHRFEIKVNGRTYVGLGETKKDAREDCADKAIPELIEAAVNKQKARPKQKTPDGRPVDLEEMEDEIPWSSIASLAIYKMYQDWIEEGYDMGEAMYDFSGPGKLGAYQPKRPRVGGSAANATMADEASASNINPQNLQFKYVDFRQPGSTQQAEIPLPTAAQQAVWNKGHIPSQTSSSAPALPASASASTSASANSQAYSGQVLETPSGRVIYNPVSRSPIQLMYELHPDANFIVNCYGSRNQVYVTDVIIRGKKYTGESNNKRDSKRNVCLAVLKAEYGVEYPACPVPNAEV